MPDISQLKVGTILENRYELIAKLGDGGFAVVWEVKDLGVNGDRKAIKICKKQDIERFRVEFNDLKDLQSDRIVKVETFYPENQPDPDYFFDDWAFFVMEKVEGTTLEQLIRKSLENSSKSENTNQYLNFWKTGYQFLFHRYPPLRSHISYIQIANWLEQITEVLKYLHSKDLIYGDLKPSNIMITPDGNIKVIDFGALNHIDDPLPSPICTPEYAPTEQQNGQARFQSDFYSFGYTILFALMGISPFNIDKDCYSLWRSQFPPELTSFLKKATETNPLDRHANTEDFTKEAKQVARSLRHQFGRWAIAKQMAVVVGIAAIATVSTLAMRSTGLIQPLEMTAYDQMLRMRPNFTADRRLLIVAIKAEDDEWMGGRNVTNKVLTKVIQSLLPYSPRVIGIAIRRDQPELEGFKELEKVLRDNNNIFGSCEPSEPDLTGGFSFLPTPQAPLGFGTALKDQDNYHRRQVLFYPDNIEGKCVVQSSFSLLIANYYLGTEHQVGTSIQTGNYKLGNRVLTRLAARQNAYQARVAEEFFDDTFQIMIDYQLLENIATTVSIRDVLGKKISPQLIRDHIVLIGRIDKYAEQPHLTPYGEMFSVELRSQVISQLISIGKGKRAFLHPASFILDFWLVLFAAIFSSFLSWRFISKSWSWLSITVGLYIGCWLMLSVFGIWLGFVPFFIASSLAFGSAFTYTQYEYKLMRIYDFCSKKFGK
jgi:CHASE2 domain-containing sensor protein